MPTKHARKLACEVVLEHFGEAVEKVCRVLVTRGQQSLGEVGRDTHLPPSQLRSCLLVLVQHNCVQALRHDADPTLPSARSQTQYVALLDSILQRLRFPKFLLHIRETMSEEAESLVEGLLEHGRLSVEQLLQRAQAHATGSEEEVEVAVKKAFAALVRGQYVERCPAAEPLVPQRYVSDVARKALRGGSRSRATVVAEGYFLAEEERIMQAAQAQDADRFRLPPTISAVADEDLDPSASPPHKATNGAATGVKRKRGAGEDNNVEVKEVLWRANYEEFMRRFRHKACVALVRERFDAVAGTVVAAVLDFGRAQETSVGQPSSASLSVEAVTHAVRSTAEGRTMPMDRVRQALQQLAADPAGLVQRSSDLGSAHYSIQMKKIIELARMREVEAVITQRFGAAACRIFRLLLLKRQLEQKQIGEMAMLPLKDSRELLYKLLKDEYVTLQEVAKTADHAPSRTFFLWRVHLPGVLRVLLDHLCKAASNLRQRLKHELEQEQEVMSLLEQRPVAGGGVAPPIQLTAAQRKQLERVRRVAAVLESSLLRLDDTIMLFSCF